MNYEEITKFVPNQGRVLVKPLNSSKTKGGIILPQTASKEFPKRGIVVATGKFSENENAEQYVVGNLVMYSSYSGT
jgi:chaperonin GroES